MKLLHILPQDISLIIDPKIIYDKVGFEVEMNIVDTLSPSSTVCMELRVELKR